MRMGLIIHRGVWKSCCEVLLSSPFYSFMPFIFLLLCCVVHRLKQHTRSRVIFTV